MLYSVTSSGFCFSLLAIEILLWKRKQIYLQLLGLSSPDLVFMEEKVPRGCALYPKPGLQQGSPQLYLGCSEAPLAVAACGARVAGNYGA